RYSVNREQSNGGKAADTVRAKSNGRKGEIAGHPIEIKELDPATLAGSAGAFAIVNHRIVKSGKVHRIARAIEVVSEAWRLQAGTVVSVVKADLPKQEVEIGIRVIISE